ncbi:phage tail protein [Planococcus rifietoensis]|uniref:phage tail protein n=1 Tax=Planococcus rifietoensis TaxID=200991 RepID=UPI00385026A2
MLVIRDKQDNEELLADFKSLSRKRKVNGEKVISVTAMPTDLNKHALKILSEESIIDFDGDEYVIKKITERTVGKKYIKNAEAIHKFFVDMINSRQRLIHSGPISFSAACQFIFSGTGYSFVIIDSFSSVTFEKFGSANRLSLLKTLLERFGAEMEIVGKQVRFKKKIGNDTDFQFRYAHNVKTFSRDIDTSNLATHIEGKGSEGITASYTSPNAEIFGIIDAEDVEDERFTSEPSLFEEIKSRLTDEPEVSLGLDFVDLRSSGYPYTVPNEGDRVFIIYEPLNDLILESRILEIDEEFNSNLVPIKTKVNLANYRKTFTGTLFGTVEKALNGIVNEEGNIRYNVLDEAVRIATEAIKSAQTELEFVNGIIARDKTNPNNLVVFTAAGVAISTDGGNTFGEAITAEGVVTSALTAGQIFTNNIQVIGNSNFYWNGDALMAIDPTDISRYVRLNHEGIYMAKGSATIEREDGYKVVNDGMLNSEFTVFQQLPPYNPLVNEDAGWWTTRESTPANCGVFFIRHDARYLKIRGVIHSDDTGLGSRFSVYDNGRGGELLAQATTYNTDRLDAVANPITMTIDLGIPDGSQRGIYLRLNTNVGGKAFGQLYKIWQEG